MSTTIGISLIVKNEEENLRRLLPLLKPYFDQIVVVDTGSTDESKKVASDLGAEVYEFPWNDNFSDARNFAQGKLTTEWMAWTDADDEWEGLENIRPIMEKVSEASNKFNALWLMYDYDQATIENKVITTAEHRRERFVRKGYGWTWNRPIHEHQITDTPNNITDDSIIVHHRRDRSRDLGRNNRNIRILRKALKVDPTDGRSWFDLGTQYFNARRWGRALACFRNFLKNVNNDVEGYQAWHRTADCYRALRQFEKAEGADFNAVQLRDNWQDAWFGLAECAFARGDFDLCLDRLHVGYACKKPNDFLVLNPRDYDYHPKVLEQRCLLQKREFAKGLEIVEETLKIVPGDPELLHVQGLYTKILGEMDIANNAIKLAKELPAEARPSIFSALPEPIRRQKQMRDLFLENVYKLERKPDIIIWCGPSLEDWGPNTPKVQGIGGSETAVIEMARELGKLGANVDVYNQCGAQEGLYGNVRYLDYSRYTEKEVAKLAVAWRNPGIGPFLNADHRWLWLHDLHAGPGLTRDMVENFTAIRPVSEYHAWFLRHSYNFMEGKLLPTRNGIDPLRFTGKAPKRNPHRAIYCSSPDRGLVHLLGMWTVVRQYVPDAELHVFYGWESFDRTIQQTGDTKMMVFKQQVLELMKQDGVVSRGRVSQPDLAKEMRQAAVLTYPTQFLEVSCITAMESMAAGCVVLSTIAGALPETVGAGGLLVRGFPTSDAYQNIFTKDIIALMKDDKARDSWSKRGMKRAEVFPWKGVAQEWLKRIA